jgi:5-formaminoimidazole-4-carboxamide-1-(beta)-D-ribofuranosyl 5'-monophosphate synthetase
MSKVTIGVLGSHSAEEVGVSAKSFGFNTVVVCQKGRESFYARHNSFLFDNKLVLNNFRDVLREENINKLQELNTVWLPNRSFSVYVGCDDIENDFPVPIYGNRFMLKSEERSLQYDLLDKAGIRRPREFKTPEEIDCLSIVKVQQKDKPLERAFFYAKSGNDYEKESAYLVKKGVISEEGVRKAVIEEFVVGPRFNANFQSYGLKSVFGDFDFVGFDDRIQTNLSGFLNLPAPDQLKISVPLTNEEVGHKGVTMRESKKPLVYEAAEKFLRASKKIYAPGVIGLFALQGALNREGEFVVFDVSPRIPGAPCLGTTSPEMRRLSVKYGKSIQSPLDLCMMEIRRAAEHDCLDEVTT